MNYACHSDFRWPFSKNSRCYGRRKVLHDMQKPRRDNLNSLTGVSFGRCWFYMGDKHVRDETVVAIFLCVCVCTRLCWPLLTQRSLYDVPLQGHFDVKVWQVHISATFCINSPARIWVTMACREYQCQACQTKQRRASGMLADATWCQYNSPSNWYRKFCSNRREPQGYIYTLISLFNMGIY